MRPDSWFESKRPTRWGNYTLVRVEWPWAHLRQENTSVDVRLHVDTWDRLASQPTPVPPAPPDIEPSWAEWDIVTLAALLAGVLVMAIVHVGLP